MLNVQFDNSLLSLSHIADSLATLTTYRETLSPKLKQGGYTYAEASLYLPFDESVLSTVREMVSKKSTSQLNYVFVVGIGGSNLGAKAVYEALRGQLDPYNEKMPKLFFADTVSSDLLESMCTLIDTKITQPEEVLINVISKSGTTAETIANFEVLFEALSKKFPNAKERVVVTTDKDSKLWQIATSKSISVLEIPAVVGGRYSVFSSVGLFPLMLAGVDVEAFIKGAQEIIHESFSLSSEEDPIMKSAVILYAHSKKYPIADSFFFNPGLESLGKWWRQLVGESLGKEHHGITPTVSIGSTDLHSVSQLYFGGPADKFFSLIAAQEKKEISVSHNPIFEGLVEHIDKQKLSTIMAAIYGGVRQTFINLHIPFVEFHLESVSAKSLGAYMQFRMAETMYVANLMGINAFNQPAVEHYKKETKKILSQES